jgi:uncharacterized membrane protein
MITEFTHGIQGAVKGLIKRSSLLLALIYTLGHICIAMMVVSSMTGASLWEAGAVALVEPSINGVWFYVLHRWWASKTVHNAKIKQSKKRTK